MIEQKLNRPAQILFGFIDPERHHQLTRFVWRFSSLAVIEIREQGQITAAAKRSTHPDVVDNPHHPGSPRPDVPFPELPDTRSLSTITGNSTCRHEIHPSFVQKLLRANWILVCETLVVLVFLSAVLPFI